MIRLEALELADTEAAGVGGATGDGAIATDTGAAAIDLCDTAAGTGVDGMLEGAAGAEAASVVDTGSEGGGALALRGRSGEDAEFSFIPRRGQKVSDPSRPEGSYVPRSLQPINNNVNA